MKNYEFCKIKRHVRGVKLSVMTFREVALILIVLICNRPSVKLHPNLLLSIQTNFLVKKNM